MISNLTTFLATSVAAEAVIEASNVDFSTEITRINTSYNKYDSLIDKTATLKDEPTLYEWLFGKDISEFERRKNNLMARQTRKGYNLKQSASRKTLNTLDGT